MSKGNKATLVCRGLTACYGSRTQHPVLQDVSFEIRPGEIVGLLGPNGAGKSSVMNAVMGNLCVTAGQVFFNEEDITSLSPEAIVRRGLRLFPQGGHIFPDLTVNENLLVAASCAPRGQTIQTSKTYDWFPDLSQRSSSRAGLLSGGQRQMLSLATVLLYAQVRTPSVFLLDEPSGSLDPTNRSRLASALQEVRDQYGVSVFLAEENAVFARETCHRFYQFVEPGLVKEICPEGPATDRL